jgi:hypothetical protein
MSNDVAGTRRALHGVAELVLAGPQFRTSGTIRLRIIPGGFATVAAPELSLDATHLVTGTGRIPLRGTTYGDLGAAAGVGAGAPEGLYKEGSGVRLSEPVAIDPAVAAPLLACFETGDAALRRLLPEATPVLWPEHFDIGVSDDEVNYGVSLGDGAVPEPYAYVGPWRARDGAFWNVPFGAARTFGELGGVEAVLAFFVEGRERARVDPVAG